MKKTQINADKTKDVAQFISIYFVSGVMGGPMGTQGMVGMGNQMVPPYGAAMPGQMGNMGMGGQVYIDKLFLFCTNQSQKTDQSISPSWIEIYLQQ